MIMTQFLNSISDDARLAPPCFGAALSTALGLTTLFVFFSGRPWGCPRTYVHRRSVII
jgi:hypothetical protein